MKYCEDLLQNWEKRIQFEATLFFFFSVVSGSSFISSDMFGNKNVILNFLPLLYVLAMFCWWYICKRLVFNTSQPLPVLKYVIALSIAIWIIISGAVSLGTWDEWGWNNKDKDVPASDNIYRLANCLLVIFYIGTLSYDYYTKIDDRQLRIKFWMLYIWAFSCVSFSYFVEWCIDSYVTNDNESIVGRYLATIGSGILCVLGLVVIFSREMNKIYLFVLFVALTMYWWGSASLDCDFYADTADMTVMPGYQMLWTMAILILIESLPTMSAEIYILGEQMLIDDEQLIASHENIVGKGMLVSDGNVLQHATIDQEMVEQKKESSPVVSEVVENDDVNEDFLVEDNNVR